MAFLKYKIWWFYNSDWFQHWFHNLFQWARMEVVPYLCYQLDFLLDFFTEDKSYQYLQDATSFVI